MTDIVKSSEREPSECESMGFVKIPLVVLFDNRLSRTQVIIWQVLMRFTDSNNECFPSESVLAKRLRTSRSVIHSNIKALEKLGYLRRVNRKGTSNYYIMTQYEDMYCDSDKRISDESLKRLEKIGEHTLVKKIVKRRKFDDESYEWVSDKSDKDHVWEEELIAFRKKINDEKKSKKAIFEDVISVYKDKEKRNESAAKKRSNNRKELSTYPRVNRPPRGTKSRVDEYGELIMTVDDVESEWRVSARSVWPESPSMCAPWDAKNKGIAKKLCTEKGHGNIIKLILHVFENWDIYKDEYSLKGHPTMGLLAAYVESWLPGIEAGETFKKSLSPRDKARKEREYNGPGYTEGDKGGITFID